jgi:hypothetical protein
MNATQQAAVDNAKACITTILRYGSLADATSYAQDRISQIQRSRGDAAAADLTAWWLTHPQAPRT